jgi:CDP-diacylglycerol--glycerol-3-phosphate 3-phosphatidyltransferase
MSKLYTYLPWINSIPNQLTMARLAVVPLLLIIHPIGSQATDIIVATLFLLASLTDILDGYLARKYDQTSKLGALLDPMADKMLVAASLVLLAASQKLYVWVCGLLICRDIAVSGMRLVASEMGKTIQVSNAGKLKTILEDTAIFSLLVGADFFRLPFRAVGMISIWLALAVSLYSAYLYLMEFLKISQDPNHIQEI